ncbi:hypothetical protein ACFL40_02570 [candidate division KSB1 bacterium]
MITKSLATLEHNRTIQVIQNLLEAIIDSELKYYINDLLDDLGYKDITEVSEPVKRAMNICKTLNIPITEHFKPVYRCKGHSTIKDLKISSIAYYLISINGDPSNPGVALAQIKIVQSVMHRND